MKVAKVVIAVNPEFTGKGSKVQDLDDEDRFGMVIRFANDTEFWVDWDDSTIINIFDDETNKKSYAINVEKCKFKD